MFFETMLHQHGMNADKTVCQNTGNQLNVAGLQGFRKFLSIISATFSGSTNK